MKENFTFEEEQIPYDQRSGCFVQMGEHYGSGKAQPVGNFKNSDKSPIPEGAYSKNIAHEKDIDKKY